MAKTTDRTETINDVLSSLLGINWQYDARLYNWPPYVFAATALLLKRSGGYTRVLRNWPPLQVESWDDHVKEIARRWRKNCNTAFEAKRNARPPARVKQLWGNVIREAETQLSEIRKDDDLAAVLIELLALSDEASVGVGLPSGELKKEIFLTRGDRVLFRHATLTRNIPLSMASVLPKQHTPRSGLTIRSMSHHLALHTGEDSIAKWRSVAHDYGSQLNIVLAPWPLSVKPKQFQEAKSPSTNFAPKSACFDFQSDSALRPLRIWMKKLLDGAIDACGRVDAIVFPEGALTPTQFESVDRLALKYGAFVVAGVLTPQATASPSRNEAWIRVGVLNSRFVQSKHHRWRIDRSQIEMYGIGGTLDPKLEWWEHIGVGSREVNFLALQGDMTMCCLICEDLARQDPVAELVREVGPNLVIALLADGPQISQRWPARYATVLADDPGSSVLTMTSIGMSQLAKPPVGKPQSRSIALWKDAFKASAQEIELPEGALGVVLNLRTRNETEWTADRRSDGGVAAYPQLVGVHVVK